MLDNLQEWEENIESDLIDKHVEWELTRINLFIRGIFWLDYSDLLDLLNRERQKNWNKTLH